MFRCLLVVLLFFWIYCITAATPLIRGYICNKAKKKTVKRQADTKTRWNSSQLSLFHGVTNGLFEHSLACRALLFFLRAGAEIKNLLCELASNAKIWRARASEHPFKFCELLKILMDHSSPLHFIEGKIRFNVI